MVWQNIGNLIDSDKYKKLKAENERLKAQLDKEIHINRKMKRALECYADHDNWYNSLEWNTYDKQGWETAEETLKEIEEME